MCQYLVCPFFLKMTADINKVCVKPDDPSMSSSMTKMKILLSFIHPHVISNLKPLRLCLDLCGILWSQKSQNDLKQKSKNTWQIILLNTENMLSLETDLTFNKIACRLSCQLYESTIEHFCKKKKRMMHIVHGMCFSTRESQSIRHAYKVLEKMICCIQLIFAYYPLFLDFGLLLFSYNRIWIISMHLKSQYAENSMKIMLGCYTFSCVI